MKNISMVVNKKKNKYVGLLVKDHIMKDDGEQHQSEVISAMRFPLIILIVIFHLYSPEKIIATPHTSYNIVATFFSAHGIARLAVPTFFLISGYLFFLHLKEWNRKVYSGKIRKRISTLLIPYLIWNLLPFVAIILYRFVWGMKTGSPWSLVKEFGDSVGWWRVLWDCGVHGGHPFDVPLWYVRDLMACCLFSPVIYYLISRTKWVFIFAIGSLYLFNIWIDVTGFSSRAWLFFSFGAYLSINRINMVCMLRKYAYLLLPLSIVLLILTTYFNSSLENWSLILNNLFLLVGVCALVGLFSYLVSNGSVRNVPFLTKSVFFIYAFHVFPLPGIASVTAFIENQTGRFVDNSLVITYFIQLLLAPLLVVTVCLAVYFFMNRFMPKLLSIATGRR